MLLQKLFFLFFPLLLIAEEFKIDPPPSWVNLFEYELSPPTIKPSQVHVQHLLLDWQKHWEEKTKFRRIALKPLSQIGVKAISQIELSYNPAFFQIRVHSIRLYRNGVWHDRLDNSRHHVLQREDGLENQVYHGTHTLVFFISDIQPGDVLEYQYSYIGENPFLSTHVDETFYLENSFSLENIYFRLLAHPSHHLLTKATNTNRSLEVRDISSDLREWSIGCKDTKAISYEPNTPSSCDPYARIQISEYKSWKEVIDKEVTLVTLPERFMEDPIPEIADLIKTWSAFDTYERIRLATRFVQNEIRYLSLSDGISALKPQDPTLCFQKRYGDCKDKTLLLHGLLKLMGISSTPILVHTEEGASLHESLPSSSLFNHMVLRVDLGIFIDSTITHQGGAMISNYFPSYHYGLPISDGENDLIALPQEKLLRPIEIETTFNPGNGQNIEMVVTTNYYDQEAEFMRRRLSYRGISQLSDGHLHYTQQLYRGAVLQTPLVVADDIDKNIFSTTERYLIPIASKKGKKRLQIQSQILNDYLETDIDTDRENPYEVPFPLWVKEHIHLNLEGSLTPMEMSFEHDSFTYSSSIQENDLNFELHILKDHITPDEISSCNEIMGEIESETDLEMLLH